VCHTITPTGFYMISNSLSLPGCVERACHAMAYHEERYYFRCTPFTLADNDQSPERLLQVRRVYMSLNEDLKQCVPCQVWFPGVHSDVGGGYKEHQISDISLLWMAVSNSFSAAAWLARD
jgi:hypothetical protein